jgi:hypothetical protein
MHCFILINLKLVDQKWRLRNFRTTFLVVEHRAAVRCTVDNFQPHGAFHFDKRPLNLLTDVDITIHPNEILQFVVRLSRCLANCFSCGGSVIIRSRLQIVWARLAADLTRYLETNLQPRVHQAQRTTCRRYFADTN